MFCSLYTCRGGGWYRLARKQGRGTYRGLVVVKNRKNSLSLLRSKPQITYYLDHRHSHYPNWTTMVQTVNICHGSQAISAVITTKLVAITSESWKWELQDVFWNADNNNRESTYNQLSAAILTPTPLVLGYILALAIPLVPTGKSKVHPITGHAGPEGE
jgi:hypothetical protein